PKLQNSMSSRPTMTLFRRENFLRLAVVLLIVAAGVIAAVMYPSHDTPETPAKTTQSVPRTRPPAPSPSVPAPAISGEDPTIRTKLDLGMNYFRNGFWDKSIQEFNEVLKIDPKNSEAKEYLQLATQKKEEADKNPPPKHKRRR